MIRNLENKGKGRGYCQKEQFKKDKEQYYKNPKKCKHCDFIISYEKKTNIFCNSSCSASFNNKGVRKNWSIGTRPIKNCPNCGGITKNSKFCCLECFFEDIRIKKLEKMRDKNAIFKKSEKKYLIKERGNKCVICGTEEWIGKPILLIIDHIDGDSDNNYLSNIRLICSNCDATLPTYKAKNKNKGRDSIRRKYRQNRHKQGSCN